MGQKIHPRGFRMGITDDYRSIWFANPKEYKKKLQNDYILRKRIFSEFKKQPISKIHIEVKKNLVHENKSYVQVKIHTPRPDVFFQSGRLKQITQSLRSQLQMLINIKFVKSSDPTIDAKLIAETIGEKLEKRKNFRQAIKKSIRDAKKIPGKIKGIKVQIGGRLNGAEMARSEWVREGRVPLHTISAKIDYYRYPAPTIYGILGIKVWVFLGF